MGKKHCNNLTGKEWLQNSFSIWRGIIKTPEERAFKHPASFPIELCKKVINTFSSDGACIIDPFNGIGSTTTAAKELSRPALGIDLSADFCSIASERVKNDNHISIVNGDSLEVLKGIPDGKFNLCLTSPPYWDILTRQRSADAKEIRSYSNNDVDLGNIHDYELFLSNLDLVFREIFRVLTRGSYCIVNVMDIRKKDKFYPFHSDLADNMQMLGFVYDDIIIWDRQMDYNNMRPLGYPSKFRVNKVHEYLLIFIKE